MEVPGIEPVTSWLVVSHAEPSVSDDNNNNINNNNNNINSNNVKQVLNS